MKYRLGEIGLHESRSEYTKNRIHSTQREVYMLKVTSYSFKKKSRKMIVSYVHLIFKRPVAHQQDRGKLNILRSPLACGFREPGEKEGCWGQTDIKTDWILNLNRKSRRERGAE